MAVVDWPKLPSLIAKKVMGTEHVGNGVGDEKREGNEGKSYLDSGEEENTEPEERMKGERKEGKTQQKN